MKKSRALSRSGKMLYVSFALSQGAPPYPRAKVGQVFGIPKEFSRNKNNYKLMGTRPEMVRRWLEDETAVAGERSEPKPRELTVNKLTF